MIIMILYKMQRVALEHGLILVDTKYEFGKGSDGSVLLIDEVRFYFHEKDFCLVYTLHKQTCAPTNISVSQKVTVNDECYIFFFVILGAYTWFE